MEQEDLRHWEGLCIQEEQPFCQAACPIHVDVRAFTRLLAAGKTDDARKTLAKTMPLPGVLGRICDHPCETKCRRGDVDAPIRIGALERACVQASDAEPRRIPTPRKDAAAAILGAGLSSLVAASDLIRKGYRVRVMTPAAEAGGVLQAYPEETLPREALAKETAALQALGVDMEFGVTLTPETVDALLADHVGVYLGMDDLALATLPERLGLGPEALDAVDTVSRLVPLAQQSDLFSRMLMGAPVHGREFSPIEAVLHGRQAAGSLIRMAQRASLTASREKEGPCETRLFTSIQDVEPEPAVDPMSSPDAPAREASRCLQCECMECVKVCPYLAHHKGYPKKYAREIYNNLSVIQGLRQANTMIDSCSVCGLCAEVCPNDFHMGELCKIARAEMVRTNKMPASAHDFALRDLAFNTSEAAVLAKPDPATGTASYAFVPGCQLAGADPERTAALYAHLRGALDGGVGLLLHCCGAPAEWAAREDVFNRTRDALLNHWRALGEPVLLCACATCLRIYRERCPEIPKASLRTVWEVVAENPLPGGAALSDDGGLELTIHDPCSARHDEAGRRAARTLAGLLGMRVQEPDLTGQHTECCGFGGLMEAANPAMADKVVARRTSANSAPFLAYCAMCRDSLSRDGAPVLHMLDLLFPDAGKPHEAAPHPLIRSSPGMADKHEQRARLVRTLRRELWNEEPAPLDEALRIPLALAPEVIQAVDARRILTEDMQRAIHHAETTGKRMEHPETGRRIAVHKPAAVTYWVEYSPEDEGYRAHRAWSHRMDLKGLE